MKYMNSVEKNINYENVRKLAANDSRILIVILVYLGMMEKEDLVEHAF